MWELDKMHVMFDLETLGTSPGCVVLSLGAVSFDPLGKQVGPGFYRTIERASCLGVGLIEDPDTVAWWAKQSDEARAALTVGCKPLKEVVEEFHTIFRRAGGEKIWCHGATFDAPIWSAAAKAVGERTPWKFFNVRDTRTVYDVAGLDTRSIPREGTHHNALDDARYQALCVQAAYARLGK